MSKDVDLKDISGLLGGNQQMKADFSVQLESLTASSYFILSPSNMYAINIHLIIIVRKFTKKITFNFL